MLLVVVFTYFYYCSEETKLLQKLDKKVKDFFKDYIMGDKPVQSMIGLHRSILYMVV